MSGFSGAVGRNPTSNILWLISTENQIEIFFSILQRKVLTPADATSLDELGERITAFQTAYEAIATPFAWKFTRADLDKLLMRLRDAAPSQVAAA